MFAEHGAKHAWLVDPDARTLEVFGPSDDGEARAIAAFEGDAILTAEPFDEVEIELGALWQ